MVKLDELFRLIVIRRKIRKINKLRFHLKKQEDALSNLLNKYNQNYSY